MPIDLLYSNYDIPRIQTSFLFSSVFLIVREHNLWEIARFRNSTLIFSSYCFSLHFFFLSWLLPRCTLQSQECTRSNHIYWVLMMSKVLWYEMHMCYPIQFSQSYHKVCTCLPNFPRNLQTQWLKKMKIQIESYFQDWRI